MKRKEIRGHEISRCGGDYVGWAITYCVTLPDGRRFHLTCEELWRDKHPRPPSEPEWKYPKPCRCKSKHERKEEDFESEEVLEIADGFFAGK